MKLIEQSHEIWEQDTSGKPLRGIITSPETIQESLIQGIYKQIERAGRVCYKSEDRITEGSAELFVDRLVNSKHYAMLEHGTVYLTIPCRDWRDYDEFLASYGSNPYTQYDDSECNWSGRSGNVYVTTNYRVLVENGLVKDALECISTPSEKHPKRVTVHFTTCRQVTHELVRHRKMSFAMESTRYCDYTKDKFGKELSFIKPVWLDSSKDDPSYTDDSEYYLATKTWFIGCLEDIEFTYSKLLSCGWKAQEAAMLLPNSLKAEIVVTGFVSDWKELFNLRVLGTTGAPHPQMKALMEPVYNEFIKEGYVQ